MHFMLNYKTLSNVINELVNSMWCIWLSHPLECARIYRKHANIWGFSLLSVDILGWYAVAFWINNSLIENSKVFIKKLKQVDFYDIRWWKWRHSLYGLSYVCVEEVQQSESNKMKKFLKNCTGNYSSCFIYGVADYMMIHNSRISQKFIYNSWLCEATHLHLKLNNFSTCYRITAVMKKRMGENGIEGIKTAEEWG